MIAIGASSQEPYKATISSTLVSAVKPVRPGNRDVLRGRRGTATLSASYRELATTTNSNQPVFQQGRAVPFRAAGKDTHVWSESWGC